MLHCHAECLGAVQVLFAFYMLQGILSGQHDRQMQGIMKLIDGN
jgi:hypothetical protein